MRIFNISEGAATWINIQLLYVFLRLPSIFADLIIGFLIYLIVKSKTTISNAIFSSSLFLFNPVIFYNSSFWGQMDSLNNVFFLIALILLTQKRYFLSILSLLLSFYVKLSLIFFLPVLGIIYYLVIKNKLSLLLSLAGSLLLIFIITLPVSSSPHIWLFEFIMKNSLGEMNNITVFAFNFWWTIFNPIVQIGNPDNLFTFSQVKMINSPPSSSLYLGMPLIYWSLAIFGVLLTPALAAIVGLKNKTMENGNLFLICSLVALSAFLFLPQMHERYLYPLFPLLSIFVGLKRKFLWIFIILSILNFINLYVVWHPMKIIFLPYGLISSHLFQWVISFITVSTGLLFYLKSIQILYAKKN